MSRTYKHKTRVLGIPVHGFKDGIYPEVEMRKWQLVENILLAATRSIRNCIFEEGSWEVKKDSTGAFSVMLKNNASNKMPSVSGVMKGVYFCGGASVVWPDLQKGQRHYLYLSPMREARVNPRAIRTYSTALKKTGRDRMPLAVLDLTEDEPKLDKHPEGKVYADSMTAPGRMLHPVVVDFRSEGRKGSLLSVQRKIDFVQVSRIYDGDWDKVLGEVAIGYHGADDVVEKDYQAVVYNSGDSGVLLRAVVFCQ